MSDFIDFISKSAPIAVIGTIIAMFVTYLQLIISRKERRYRIELEMMREKQLKMELDVRNKRVEELQQQVADLMEKIAATERKTVELQEMELARLRQELSRKEGQKQ
jgi:hypothetical protein